MDASFQPGTGANDDVLTVAVQIDGKILIGGNFTNVNGVDCKRVARLNADGSVDRSFDTSSGPDGPVNALAVRPDGKVLIGGLFNSVTGIARTNIAQLNGKAFRIGHMGLVEKSDIKAAVDALASALDRLGYKRPAPSAV